MNGLKEDGCEQQLESGLLPSRFSHVRNLP